MNDAFQRKETHIYNNIVSYIGKSTLLTDLMRKKVRVYQKHNAFIIELKSLASC